MTSGRTFVELRPFYRSQEVNSVDDDVHTTSKTNGLDFSLFWDNRDYPLNPTKGNGARMRVSRDFGQFDSNNSWTVMEGEFDYYHPFGSSDRFSQRVLALDAWTAYSPTWKVNDDGTISNGPPQYQGATLGGLWKMRGYSANRFSDKAALYFAAEYRVIPQKNPFDRWPKLVDMLGIKWAQYTVFAEAGRVGPNSQLDTLTDEMKWDLGGGIRLLASGLIARIDLAVSEEEVCVQMMVAHPFQF
jgi:outer membrane protein assembly factor BamA